ncbi:methylated-DNA--[protein]-cysteine S-methyltransferase [Kitasatospora sp. NPDC088134]|uniref:methylated-DNA--[protein]-cysteine S-methyltransferase n=1 Tax=Kitasatospora sp. NPDC088134 TaxID=3364071 RepID=UPI00381F42F6
MNRKTAVLLATVLPSPIGTLLLTGEPSATAPGGTALASLTVLAPDRAAATAHRPTDHEAFTEITRQLAAYFDGTLTAFAVECTARGTAFQHLVWNALAHVPYGTTSTYERLAADIGSPGAARAVGAALAANPVLLVRPCHRVLGADGALRGYAAGTDAKQHLLDHEAAHARAAA